MNEDGEMIDVVESVEFLLSELKNEWDKSKTTKYTISLPRNEARALLWMVIGKGTMLGSAAEKRDLSFKEDMHVTKTCHIFLRIAEKLDYALNQEKSNLVKIDLDAEEYEQYYPIRRVQSGGKDGGKV